MATEIFVHKMTEHMETAIILSWFAKEGDQVQKGAPILEVETEKATVEIESPESGILKGIRPGAGEKAEVKVGETLAFIAAIDEEVPALPPIGIEKSEPAENSSIPFHVSEASSENPGGILATPVARRVAEELNISLENVKGSGPGGRIREDDVLKMSGKKGDPPSDQKFSRIPLNNIQKITAKQMLLSTNSIPQYTLTAAIDFSSTIKYRDEVQKKKGVSISFNAVIVKAVAYTLRNHPRLNASLEDEYIRLNELINIGLAVGTEEGLYVPVIKNADEKTILEINDIIQTYKEKSGSLRFSPNELTGATFTISNLGMYGIDQFNAIINPPQAAILAIGQINQIATQLSPDAITFVPKSSFSLTVDHRFLDGYHASLFLKDLKMALETANYA